MSILNNHRITRLHLVRWMQELFEELQLKSYHHGPSPDTPKQPPIDHCELLLSQDNQDTDRGDARCRSCQR